MTSQAIRRRHSFGSLRARLGLHPRHMGHGMVRAMVLASLLALVLPATPRAAGAVNPPILTVNSTADIAGPPGSASCVIPGDSATCTLRAAIMAANHTPGGGATIIVPAGIYHLTIGPQIGDDETNGDFNVNNLMTIQGAGPDQTYIDATGLNDRVFDVAVAGPATISGVNIAHGSVNGPGGGIYAAASPLYLLNSVVKRSHSADNGGGLYNNNKLVVLHSLIEENDTDTAGGGIWTDTEFGMANSTVSNNQANAGAGIYNYPGSLARIVNSTVAGNLAVANGGGIYNKGSGDLGLFNSTIANNQADRYTTGSGVGGGVYSDPAGTFGITNTIVANNLESFFVLGAWYPTAGNCHGTLKSSGYNMLDLANCTISGAYTLADPKLGPLQYNGGPTPTLALLPGSPAIDAGDPVGCEDDQGLPLLTDQRGQPRFNGKPCDLGAYEVTTDLWLPLVQP